MKKMYFKYTKFGKIQRLVVEGFLMHEAVKVTGAVQSRDKKVFTYAPDEITARQLKKMFPTMQVDKSINMWLDESAARVKHLTAFKQLESCELTVENSDKLYPFQTVDIKFMQQSPRCINANQMGTGKTIESLMLADEIGAEKVLVVCSQSKMDDWIEEIEKWNILDSSLTKVAGSPLKKQKALYETTRFKVITHGLLRDTDRYGSVFIELWDLVLIDEGHRLKNIKSAQANGASRLKSKNFVIITGTPMLNRPSELYALLHILFPERFGSYWDFVERFCTTEEGFNGSRKITGVKNTDVLQYILAPIMIRRLKKDVMAYLPEKIYKTVHVELTGDAKKAYKQMEKESMIDLDNGDAIMASNRLTQMVRLRQLALDPGLLGEGPDLRGPKTAAIMDILEEAIENGEKVVVFSVSRRYIERLSLMLTAAKINHATMHGKLNETEKSAAKRKFQQDPNCCVFVCTLGTGGEGLNLQNASIEILADKSWVPGDMEQAEDRLHRDGQTKNPLIISIVCKDTIDEDIEEVLQDKTNTITEVMAMDNIVKKILARN